MTFCRIGPAFINVNYVFPGISSTVARVKIAYGEDVKGLLQAILADLANRGLNVPPKEYVVLKTSIGVYTDLSSRIPTAEAQELLEPQALSDVFEEVPKREWVHVLVKPRFSGMDFIYSMSKIDLFICLHKHREVFAQ